MKQQIDDVLIKGVRKIANYRIKKAYPLMDENHYSKYDVRMILESLAMILEEYELRRTDSKRTRTIPEEE